MVWAKRPVPDPIASSTNSASAACAGFAGVIMYQLCMASSPGSSTCNCLEPLSWFRHPLKSLCEPPPGFVLFVGSLPDTLQPAPSLQETDQNLTCVAIWPLRVPDSWPLLVRRGLARSAQRINA